MPLLTQSRGRSCLTTLLLCLVVGTVCLGAYVLFWWASTPPRLNVLVLGLDRRPDQGYVVRSDTMMLMTVYRSGPRAAILSVPRDLYVEIPDVGADRINTAHFWGESQVEGGGPVLASRTVAQAFGVPVHRCVRVDFDGFRAIIDAAGGVDVFVEEAVVDNAYPSDDYGVVRIEIPAGQQHMDGETALRYVRSRHGSSDFNRAERQQQVLIALAHRLLEPGTWPRLPLVHRAVTSSVDTDLTTRDLLLFFTVVHRVGVDGIEHHVIGREMTQPWTKPTGAAVLLPRWELIRPLVQDLFTP
jgi:LCP family protein required for cell wall assembly